MPLLLALLLAAKPAPALVFADQPQGATEASVRAWRGGAVVELARVPVAEDTLPAGAVSPDGRTLALAVIPPGAGPLRGALLAVDLASGAVRRLAEGLLAQERPRFTSDGRRVLFVRLRDFEEPPPERMREGELGRVTTEVWSAALDGSGERRLAAIRAYGVNLVGARPGEVLLYRVDRDRVSIDALPEAGGAPRTVLTLPHGPFARDFSVVGGALVLATLADPARRAYAVLSYDLASGAARTLLTAPSDHLRPLATPAGVVLTRPADEGDDLVRLGRPEPLLRAQGGRWLPEAASPDLGRLALRRLEPGGGRLVLWREGALEEVPTAAQFEVYGFGGVGR